MGKATGFLELGRKTPPKRGAKERVEDYLEIYADPPEEAIRAQASRCMDCGVPFCNSGCPLGNIIPDWNDLVYRGKWHEALDRLHRTNNFPEFTGRICPAPCESACVLGINDDPVTIEFIEKTIAERGFAEGWVVPEPPATRTGRKVAVIGSGPAGLAAAQQLNRAGHSVTLFEKQDRLGGLLRYGIPDFKLEKWTIDRRVEIMVAEGVEVRTRVHVGRDVSGPELLREFDAVLLAGGAESPRDLAVPGRDLEGVHFAMDFLEQQNRRVAGDRVPDAGAILAAGKNVLVLGGGDTGSDCIGTSHRQGAKHVYNFELLERPPEGRPEEAPWPVHPAPSQILRTSSSHEEGGSRDWGVSTIGFSGDGRVQKLNAVRVRFGPADATGRRAMETVKGSEFSLDVDLVLLAMGFLGPVKDDMLKQFGVDLSDRGNVATRGYATSVPRVYAAGDMRRGQSLVVWAIAEGREAAAQIDRDLSAAPGSLRSNSLVCPTDYVRLRLTARGRRRLRARLGTALAEPGGNMLRKHSEVLRGLLALGDLALVAAAWLTATWLRFGSGYLPEPTRGYDLADYPWLLLGILPIWHILLRWRGLYDGHRVHSLASETRRIVEVCLLGTVLIATLTFFGRLAWVSRLTVGVFAGTAGVYLVASRIALRLALRRLRRQGRFVHDVLIVGTGSLAREIHARLTRHPELGFSVRGFVGPSSAGLGGESAPWLGGYDALHDVVSREQIDQVVLAIDRSDPANPLKLLRELHDTTAAVRFVPDLLGIDTVQGGIEDFDGLPMIRLIESPLVGWNAIAKRVVDVVGSASALVVGAPVFAALALAVKWTSPGPVFYRQERMGLDGRLFSMWKFRTMVPDAERETGAVWAVANDSRRTPLGSFLRRSNLDEIPQFWNVLRGEMSLVGPRPERPEFIREFRAGLPGYMLRHKVKGGLTGWAQVNGCRGNTSIEKRLEFDMAYLRRWSLGFDIKIMLLTVVRGFNDPNAY